MSGEFVQLKADYYEDPKIIRAGTEAELLYVRMLALCARKFTDGFVPGELLASLRLSHGSRRVESLLREALIGRVDGGYQVTAWLKHNRPVQQMVEERQAQSRAGNYGSHLRWHVQKRSVVRNCEWCKANAEAPNDDGVPHGAAHDDSVGHPNGPLMHRDRDIEETETETGKTTRASARELDPLWKRFYDAYPKHVAPLKARKAFEAAVTHGANPEEIIAGAERYRDDPERRRSEPKFTAHPATWLNAGRWQDESASTAGTAPRFTFQHLNLEGGGS